MEGDGYSHAACFAFPPFSSLLRSQNSVDLNTYTPHQQSLCSGNKILVIVRTFLQCTDASLLLSFTHPFQNSYTALVHNFLSPTLNCYFFSPSHIKGRIRPKKLKKENSVSTLAYLQAQLFVKFFFLQQKFSKLCYTQ